MKKLFKSYSFWAALSCAVAIFLEDLSELLNLDINVSLVESVIMSFCGVLVVLGIVNKKDNQKKEDDKIIDTTSKDIEETIDLSNNDQNLM